MSWFKRLFAPSPKQAERAKLREKILSETIDFNNVVSSSFHAKALYDELKVVAHPDRFLDEQDTSAATELFQLVVQHKGDYEKLIALKERIYNELPIKK